MRRTTTLAGAAITLAAVAATAITLLAGHPAAEPEPSHVAPAAAYVQALDLAEGWGAPSPQQRATDLATGQQICWMLAHGWNEAGAVATVWAWPASAGYSQEQIEVAVHVTRVWLCGQSA